AMQSDSARIWDLAFGEPVRAIAVSENEALIGLDAGARHLVTATQDSVNVWDTATGDRMRTLSVGAAGSRATLTAGGSRLFVEHRGDVDTHFELWDIEQGVVASRLIVAGVPALVAVDPTGARVAVADYDRAVRVWDLSSGALLGQIDLPLQSSVIRMAAGGETLGAVHGRAGISLWSVARPRNPLLEEFADGDWQLVFAPSGASVLAGRAETGYQIYASSDGRLAGPPIGVRGAAGPSTLLAFSEDEKIVFTGNPGGMSRFWRATGVPPAADGGAGAGGHSLWQPSGDRIVTALPGNRGIVIGDNTGHVHVLPAGASLDDVRALSEDVSFLGHTAEVRILETDAAGRFVASAAADNSVRVWDVETGQPLPYLRELEGDPIRRLSFSPSAARLAVLRGTNLALLEVSDGTIAGELELGEVHRSLAFVDDDRLLVGSDSGSLRRLRRDADGNWSMRRMWQGKNAITRLGVSPRGDQLVLVDASGTASQFVLAEGRIGEQTLTLPGPIEEVAFNRGGSRAYLRTARWTHRASLSTDGLVWVDSVFSPKPLNGAGIVFGPPDTDTANRAFLPAARNGFVEMVELPFPGSSHPGLFGGSRELLAEWRRRLGYAAAETP
ncbi:MAG: WD40 repeat domain-containing protein, partial [Proteobacteria bacterium]|nr:WD40 repeat domain-containing protein [Pseudomonadota bacterium]